MFTVAYPFVIVDIRFVTEFIQRLQTFVLHWGWTWDFGYVSGILMHNLPLDLAYYKLLIIVNIELTFFLHNFWHVVKIQVEAIIYVQDK